jgi:hypothetical protein
MSSVWMFATFMTVRVLDLVSTYACMSKYQGWSSIEAAPVSGFLIEHVGFYTFIPVNLLLSALVGIIVIAINRDILRVFIIINLLVVISNTLIYLLI